MRISYTVKTIVDQFRPGYHFHPSLRYLLFNDFVIRNKKGSEKILFAKLAKSKTSQIQSRHILEKAGMRTILSKKGKKVGKIS